MFFCDIYKYNIIFLLFNVIQNCLQLFFMFGTSGYKIPCMTKVTHGIMNSLLWGLQKFSPFISVHFSPTTPNTSKCASKNGVKWLIYCFLCRPGNKWRIPSRISRVLFWNNWFGDICSQKVLFYFYKVKK